MKDILRVSLVQCDIAWENIDKNLFEKEKTIKELAGKTDFVIFPEMFTTGFTMNSHSLYENNDGKTITRIKKWANEYQVAISGSFIAEENNRYYNRAFFAKPDGEVFFYDKRHLFRMGNENKFFTSGETPATIHYNGWNISLAICYDLRFPVWLRNQNNNYDLLVVVANWPDSRISAWKTLLSARAIENGAYVCGVNRIGDDATTLHYPGESMICNMKGESLAFGECDRECIVSAELSLQKLQNFRNKFPMWKDSDSFKILS